MRQLEIFKKKKNFRFKATKKKGKAFPANKTNNYSSENRTGPVE